MLTIIIIALNLTWIVATIAAILCLIGANLGMSAGAFAMIAAAGLIASYSANLVRNAINGIDT